MLRFCNDFSIAKELLSICKYAFVDLHYCYGMDFQKPFSIYKGKGKFTRKSIEKMCGNGENFSESTAVLIMRGTYRCNQDYIYGVRIVENGFEQENSSSFPFHDNFKQRLDWFTSKGSFEENRKNYSGTYYVVIQRNEYLNEGCHKCKRIDYSERVKIIPKNEMYYNGGKISQNGIKQHYSEISYYKPERFDKSGYFNIGSEKRYSTKLRNLKAERARAAVNYAEISDFYNRELNHYEEIKKILADAVMNGTIASLPYEYSYYVKDLKYIKERIETKSFSSQNAAMEKLCECGEWGKDTLVWILDKKKEIQ